jgi:hypothetical protein
VRAVFPSLAGSPRQAASWWSATIVPTFPTAHTATPTQASQEIVAYGSRQTSANGSEKKTTNSAWNWKNQKNLRLALAPHVARSAR